MTARVTAGTTISGQSGSRRDSLPAATRLPAVSSSAVVLAGSLRAGACGRGPPEASGVGRRAVPADRDWLLTSALSLTARIVNGDTSLFRGALRLFDHNKITAIICLGMPGLGAVTSDLRASMNFATVRRRAGHLLGI